MIRTPRSWLVAASLLVAPMFAGCGGGDSASTGSSTSTVKSATGASFNDADVTFVQGMIPHHEQAIEMAELALDPESAASETTRALAQRIRGAQDPEVQKMRGWLKTWGKSELTEMTNHAEHGMLEAKDMTALDALKGAEFDRKFAALMIQHHEGAVEMSEKVKSAGTDPEVRALADAIIKSQRAEIEELRPLANA